MPSACRCSRAGPLGSGRRPVRRCVGHHKVASDHGSSGRGGPGERRTWARAAVGSTSPTVRRLHEPAHGSLPAFQSFGEEKPAFWLDASTGAAEDPAIEAHTLAHVVIRALGVHAGVGQPSLRERVYLDPVPAILIYVATGDQIGPLVGYPLWPVATSGWGPR